MEDLVVACPLVPNVPHLVSGSCSSPRTFAPRFLQTPPHGDALALRLSFGSTSTWTGDFHPQAVRHARHTRPRLTRGRSYLMRPSGAAAVRPHVTTPIFPCAARFDPWLAAVKERSRYRQRSFWRSTALRMHR